MPNARLFQFRYSYERDLVDIYAQVALSSPASAAPAMGIASGYAALASSTITNTGSTVITGKLGLNPGSSVTGFPPGTVSGGQHIADGESLNAQNAITAAYSDLAGRSVTTNYSGTDMGTLTLTAGVYKWNTSAQLTGAMTLNGSATDVFIFQIGTTLTTASASSIVLTGGALASNVFFQVGSSATLGTTTAFKGNILAAVSITVNTGASVLGGLYAKTGAITLDTNIVTVQPLISTLTMSNSKGILSVVRNSAGNYTFALKDIHYLFMDADCISNSGSSAPAAPCMNLVSQSMSGKSIRVQMRDLSGVASDPSAGEILYFHFVVRDAST